MPLISAPLLSTLTKSAANPTILSKLHEDSSEDWDETQLGFLGALIRVHIAQHFLDVYIFFYSILDLKNKKPFP